MKKLCKSSCDIEQVSLFRFKNLIMNFHNVFSGKSRMNQNIFESNHLGFSKPNEKSTRKISTPHVEIPTKKHEFYYGMIFYWNEFLKSGFVPDGFQTPEKFLRCVQKFRGLYPFEMEANGNLMLAICIPITGLDLQTDGKSILNNDPKKYQPYIEEFNRSMPKELIQKNAALISKPGIIIVEAR